MLILEGAQARAVVAHDPAQARRLPPRLRRLRPGARGALPRSARRAAARRPGHRAQPPEGRRRGRRTRAPSSKSRRRHGASTATCGRFVGGKPQAEPLPPRSATCRASTPESDALSKDLPKRGFKFVGSTICYAYMQAVGLVNDHLHELPALRGARPAREVNWRAGRARIRRLRTRARRAWSARRDRDRALQSSTASSTRSTTSARTPYASLSEGACSGAEIECPLHGGCFDVTTGRALGGIVTEDLRRFAVRVDGDDVLLALGRLAPVA